MVPVLKRIFRLALPLVAAGLMLPRPAVPAPEGGGWSMIVRDIKIDEGLWKWEGSLKDGLALKVGQPYRATAASRSVRLLMATGNFKSVDMVSYFTPDGVRVKFELDPLEMVSAVTIKGNYFILKKVIRSVVRTSRHGVLDMVEAEKDREKIRDLYRRRGFFETDVKMSVAVDRRKWGKEIIFEIDEGKPGVIQHVVLEGNDSFSAGQLAQHHQLLALSFFNEEKIEEATARLLEFYRQEGFIEAKAEVDYELFSGPSLPSLSLVEPLKSISALLPGQYVGVDIRFKITEGEKFGMTIEGNRGVSERRIRQLLTFQRSGFFDQYEADESRVAVMDYYRNNGYYHAAVDVELEPEEKLVRVVIEEGPEVKIRRINFSGNKIITSRGLRRLMNSRPGRLREKPYRADVLKDDRKRIEAYYLSRGFTRAVVHDEEVSFNEAKERMDLLFVIDEGPRAKLGEITFSGSEAYEEERLRKVIGRGYGDYFDPDWVDTAKKKILDLYSRLGFADCRVNATLDFSDDGEWVKIGFNVREGRQRLFGNLLVEGNRRTSPVIVQREFHMREGDAYDPIKIFQGRRRLFDLGLFSQVYLVNPEPVEKEETDLIVKVGERTTSRLSIGVGYDSEERYRGFIEVGENNLWGTARGIRLRWKVSTKGRRYDIIYKEPWIFGFEQDVNFDIYDEFKEEIGYDIRRVGGRIFSDRNIMRYLNLYTAYRYEAVNYSSVKPDLLQEEDLPDELRIGSIQLRLSYDRRDNAVNPHRGYYASGGVEFAYPFLASDAQFNKYELQATYVKPMTAASEIVFSTRLGMARKIISGDELPFSERFFTGGASTVRGYAEKSLGPKSDDGTPLGGEMLALGNLEWRFKIYRSFGGVIFFDMGNVWSSPSDFDLGDIRESVGAGIRYETPVGPARLEYGYQLDPEPGAESRYRVHFTLGHPF